MLIWIIFYQKNVSMENNVQHTFEDYYEIEGFTSQNMVTLIYEQFFIKIHVH